MFELHTVWSVREQYQPIGMVSSEFFVTVLLTAVPTNRIHLSVVRHQEAALHTASMLMPSGSWTNAP
jgi:hypothetical protein